jgi:mannose-6-phosphate isomerase-like protein (cupin superfamily)
MIVTSGSGIMRVSGKEVDLSFGFIFFIGQGVDAEFEKKDEKVMVHKAYAE